eukprot:SAG31_NODE_247_length_19134_cov_12.255050_14_plen_400_part_00
MLYGEGCAGGGDGAPRDGAAQPHAPKTTGSKRQLLRNISVSSLQTKYRKGEPISMITAYDYPSAQAADAAGVDMILVGDSLGMVVLGYESTTPVSMAEMLHHCKAVARGTSRPFRVGDLPFGASLTPQDAVQNACKLVKEGGMDGVKLEGGAKVVPQVEAITAAGINVVGHIGLTPQTAVSLGGYKVQGKSASAAQQLLDDALALQTAGCHAVVLECVPDRVAAHCTRLLDVPTIGIGAGPFVSGQVQVLHDTIGLYDKLQPKFSRRYCDSGSAMRRALAQYVDDVASAAFPSAKETFTMADDEYELFINTLQAHHRLQSTTTATASGRPESVSLNSNEDMIMDEIRELRRSLKMRLEMLESVVDSLATANHANAAEDALAPSADHILRSSISAARTKM